MMMKWEDAVIECLEQLANSSKSHQKILQMLLDILKTQDARIKELEKKHES